MTAVKRPQMERALDSAASDIRAFLLYGPDESASRELAGRITRSLGNDAERMDFTGAQLRVDPALLADEAASISMFGGRRHIRVEPAGDEILPAVEALLGAPSAGNPVVIIAGALRKDAKLVKLATADARMMALISYVPDEGNLGPIAAQMARDHGIRLAPDVAQRLAAATNGDRALLARELEKLACYVDASPDRPIEVTHEALDALGADADEGDLSILVDAALSGNLARADAELTRLSGSGVEAISIVRRFLQRLLLLAQLRSEVDRGQSPAGAVAAAGKMIFWKDKDLIAGQLSRWDSPTIATAIARFAASERAAKSSQGAGALTVEVDILALGRLAARRR